MSTTSEAEVRFRVHAHHPNHHALVAVSRVDGQGIAAARCIRHEHDHESAEVDVSVDEEWQGKGIGIELVKRMVEHARSLGVQRIVVTLPAGAGAAALTA
jgi:GNAT superfamily N-acetyltransferase